MSAIIENVRVKVHGGEYGLENVGPIISCEFEGEEAIDYLDDDGTLCASHESNLHNYLDTDTANVIRDALRDWLKAYASVTVSVNGADDLFMLNVAADADDEAITEAIEGENLFFGGSESEPVFSGFNDVAVFRNGIEITSLKVKAEPRRPTAA